MKKFFCVALFASIATLIPAFAGLQNPPSKATAVGETTELRSDKVEEIYLNYRRVATISFKTEREIQKFSFGSNIVSYRYDEELQQLELRARFESGSTNMNVVIDGKVYPFMIHIVRDNRGTYSHRYSLEEEFADDFLAAAQMAKPVPPDKIDIVGMTNTIERARVDPQFRRTVPNLFTFPVGKTYAWNGCPVTLHDVSFFSNHDTLVFRIEFYNNSDKALYLHSRQYRIMVAGREFHATVRTQLASTVFPGQMDKVFLFIQGYRIDPRNQWELVLPPEADSVRALLGGR
jgi:hypothetical protein